MFLNLFPISILIRLSAFPGLSVKDTGADNPYSSYLGRSESQLTSCWEEISYQEVREEIIERKQPGLGSGLTRKLDIPITIRDVAGAGRNKTNTESVHLTKLSPRSQEGKTEKVGEQNEIIKPFTRKLTYTVPIEGAQPQSQLKNSTSESSGQKVFPPKSPKKIQFEADGQRSKYILSSQKIIKDQSKPTPPDVDDAELRGKKSRQESRWKPSTGPRLELNAGGETDRSIKNLSELTEVGETIRGSQQTLSTFTSILGRIKFI